MEGVREINGGRYEHVSFYTCMPFSRIKKIYKKIRRLKGGGHLQSWRIPLKFLEKTANTGGSLALLILAAPRWRGYHVIALIYPLPAVCPMW